MRPYLPVKGRLYSRLHCHPLLRAIPRKVVKLPTFKACPPPPWCPALCIPVPATLLLPLPRCGITPHIPLLRWSLILWDTRVLWRRSTRVLWLPLHRVLLHVVLWLHLWLLNTGVWHLLWLLLLAIHHGLVWHLHRHTWRGVVGVWMRPLLLLPVERPGWRLLPAPPRLMLVLQIGTRWRHCVDSRLRLARVSLLHRRQWFL